MDIQDIRLTGLEMESALKGWLPRGIWEKTLLDRGVIPERRVADAATAKALRAVYAWLGVMDECSPQTPLEDCVCGRFRVAFGDMLEIWDVEGNMTEIELGT